MKEKDIKDAIEKKKKTSQKKEKENDVIESKGENE